MADHLERASVVECFQGTIMESINMNWNQLCFSSKTISLLAERLNISEHCLACSKLGKLVVEDAEC